jgi:hypothetical protein
LRQRIFIHAPEPPSASASDVDELTRALTPEATLSHS